MLDEVEAGESSWRKAWEEADLPDGTRSEWRKVMIYRTMLPDDAVELARHGWTPQDIVSFRTDWLTALPELKAKGLGSDAWALLANETAKYHDSLQRIALEFRAKHISALDQLPAGQRWSQVRIASLLGLKKQRVQAILKRKAL